MHFRHSLLLLVGLFWICSNVYAASTSDKPETDTTVSMMNPAESNAMLRKLPPIIALIDGDPLATELFLWYLNAEMPSVYDEFLLNQSVKNNKAFWEKKVGQRSPWTEAKQTAMKTAIRDLTQMQIFKQGGYLEDISWEFIERYRIAENQKRQIAFKKNEVIAGPREWSPYSFYKNSLKKTVFLYQKDLGDSLVADRTFLTNLHKGSHLKNRPYLDVVEELKDMVVERQYGYIVSEAVERRKVQINTQLFEEISYALFIEWLEAQPKYKE